MRKYLCKNEVNDQILESTIRSIFGKVERKGNRYISTYSDSLEVIAEITGKREISVETKTTPGKDQETIVKLYNRFLGEVTGYTAKERKKLASKV